MVRVDEHLSGAECLSGCQDCIEDVIKAAEDTQRQWPTLQPRWRTRGQWIVRVGEQ